MKDSVNTLFQQRFQGHEAPVDPGVWQGIQQQLAQAAPASGEDGVSELFKERFHGHEVAVDPAVWSTISSQLGHTAVAGTAAGSAWLGWAAAGVVSIVVATVALVSTEKPQNNLSEQRPTTVENVQKPQLAAEVIAEKPSEEDTRQDEKAEPAPVASNPRENTVTARANSVALASDPRPILTEPASTPPAIPETPATTVASVRSGEAIVERIIKGLTEETQQEVRTTVPKAKDELTPPLPTEFGDPVMTEEVATLPKLFMPNTFTPNGDGVNDEYEVGGVEAYQHVVIRVSSLKTGQTVFSTNSNGPWRGEGCEDGMYLVALEARMADGRATTEGKVVWLNRNPMN